MRPTICDSSSICARPSALTISSAARPVAIIFSKTSFAIEPLIVPFSTSASRPASRAGARRSRSHAGSPPPASFTLARTAPSSQFRATFASAPAATVSSKYGARPAPVDRHDLGVREAVRRLQPGAQLRRRLRQFVLRVLEPRRLDAPAAADPARGNSGSRAPLPCCASRRCASSRCPRAAFPARPAPPDSTTSIWRSISCSRASSRKRNEFRFLISAFVPSGLAPSVPHRDVRVAAQAALFHVAVVHAERDQQLAQVRRRTRPRRPPSGDRVR